VWSCFAAPAGVANEICNVADDAPTRKDEVVRWLAEHLGVATPIFSGEPAPGRRAVTPDRVIANEKLKRMFGWRPQFASFREGYENLLSRQLFARMSRLPPSLETEGAPARRSPGRSEGSNS